ncbi:hypothetical protein L4D76_19220 [Photobacterium sagamiensis]|uniref:hypothetical protein n=1 Tax=Photobacterium sagamiensis TaxID=2910241 RepID=UPI003D1520F5
MRKILVAAFGLSLVAILITLSAVSLTEREVSLFSTALAMLSIAFSWLITDIYSESSKKTALQEAQDYHKENLKTYVINASEKVNNISNELNKLSLRLKEISKDSQGSDVEDVKIINEKIVSTTNIIESLKSFNDTAISDWKGIIGEDVKTFQQKENELKQKQIESLLLRIENLEEIDNEQEDDQSAQSVLDARKDLDNLLSDSGIILNEHKKIQHVTRKCPECNTTIGYDQHIRHSNIRSIRCPSTSCNRLLVSEYDQDKNKFTLANNHLELLNQQCEICDSTVKIELPKIAKASESVTCHCGNVITAKRKDGIVQIVNSKNPSVPRVIIKDDLILKVQEKLPPQPWPRNIHKTVAYDLGISNRTVQRVIKHLIEKGVFYEQKGGELFAWRKVETSTEN